MKYLLVALLLSFSTLNAQQEEFKKIKIEMPITIVDTVNWEVYYDDLEMKFKDSYVGLLPDQLFEFDVSRLVDRMNDTTRYRFYMMYCHKDTTVKRDSDFRAGNIFIFTKHNVVDGKLLLPWNFCSTNLDFNMLEGNAFFNFTVSNKDNRDDDTVFSKVCLVLTK